MRSKPLLGGRQAEVFQGQVQQGLECQAQELEPDSRNDEEEATMWHWGHKQGRVMILLNAFRKSFSPQKILRE